MGLAGDRTRAEKKRPGPRPGAGPSYLTLRYSLLLELLHQKDSRAPTLADQAPYLPVHMLCGLL